MLSCHYLSNEFPKLSTDFLSMNKVCLNLEICLQYLNEFPRVVLNLRIIWWKLFRWKWWWWCLMVGLGCTRGDLVGLVVGLDLVGLVVGLNSEIPLDENELLEFAARQRECRQKRPNTNIWFLQWLVIFLLTSRSQCNAPRKSFSSFGRFDGQFKKNRRQIIFENPKIFCQEMALTVRLFWFYFRLNTSSVLHGANTENV